MTEEETTKLFQLQKIGSGILHEGYDENAFIQCLFAEKNVDKRDELYIFRCSNLKECCGRECCNPSSGIPVWLLLILLLIMLLALALCAGLTCYGLRIWRRRKAVRIAKLIWKSDKNGANDSEDKSSTPPPPPPPPCPAANTLLKGKKFFPDPVHHIVLQEPEPIAVEFHDAEAAELTPLIRPTDKLQPQKPKVMYFRKGTDEVASY